MKRRYRLRSKSEFRSTLDGLRVFSGRGLIAIAKPSPYSVGRLGVTVSRQIRSAVPRNRARRRLRELARIELIGGDWSRRLVGIRYDVVLIARPAVLDLPFDLLRQEAAGVAAKLLRLPQ